MLYLGNDRCQRIFFQLQYALLSSHMQSLTEVNSDFIDLEALSSNHILLAKKKKCLSYLTLTCAAERVDN